MTLTFLVESSTSVDLININELPGKDVLALLYPLSDSAIKSLAQTKRFSSLDPETSDIYSANQSRKRTQKIPISLLERSSQVEKYTLGTCKDNNIILQHNIDNKTKYWIFFLHCELYPDPDHDALTLYNISNIQFSAQRLHSDAPQVLIPEKKFFSISYTTWRLNLREGLDFHLKVISQPQATTNAL